MKHPNRLYFCVAEYAKFSVSPFPLSEEKASDCSGILHKMTPFLWEVEGPSTYRDAHWLVETPSSKATGKTMRTFLRWRLRRYLKDEKAEVMVRKSPFDNCAWLFTRENPCYAEGGEQANVLRTKLMRAVHELHHFHPALAATVLEYWGKRSDIVKDDTYTIEIVKAAIGGAETFTPDPVCLPATYTDQPDAKVPSAAQTPEDVINSFASESKIIAMIASKVNAGNIDNVLPTGPSDGETVTILPDVGAAEPTPEMILEKLLGKPEPEAPEPTPEEIMSKLPGAPTGNIPPTVEAVRERVGT